MSAPTTFKKAPLMLIACAAASTLIGQTAASLAQPVEASTPVSWIAQEGDWDLGSNWSTGAVPGPNDDVVIDVSDGAVVTFRSGFAAVRSLTSRNQLVVAGGVLVLASTSALDAGLTLRNGALLGPGELTINGPFEWTGGLLSGGGRAIANGGILLHGPADKWLGRSLENTATASWQDGALRGRQGELVNRAGASFTLGDRCFCGSGRFLNEGTLEKVWGLGRARFEGSFENSGDVLVHIGQLEIAGGGTASGTFRSDVDSGLTFSRASYQLRGATLTAPGASAQLGRQPVNVTGPVNAETIAELYRFGT
jgi:hypothetical protein